MDISLEKANSFSSSKFTFLLSCLALFVLIFLMMTTLLTKFPLFSCICMLVIYFIAFVRLFIVAKKTVFDLPYSFYCSKEFLFRQFAVLGGALALLSLPVMLPALFVSVKTLIVTLPVMIPITLVLLTGYMEDFYILSFFTKIPVILKKRKNVILLTTYSVLALLISNALALFVLSDIALILPYALRILSPCAGPDRLRVLIIMGFFLSYIYRLVPRIYRTYLLLSTVLIVPSIIICIITCISTGSELELTLVMMFIILAQLLWYFMFFVFYLQIKGFAFVCHLIAQTCFHATNPNSKATMNRRLLVAKRRIMVAKASKTRNYFDDKKNFEFNEDDIK